MNDEFEQASKEAGSNSWPGQTEHSDKKTSEAKIQIQESLRCDAWLLTVTL